MHSRQLPRRLWCNYISRLHNLHRSFRQFQSKWIWNLLLYTGAKYSGTWRDHEFHGEGLYIYPDGTKEFGTWENGTLVDAKDWIDSTANRKPITWAMIVGVSNYRHLKPLELS